METGTEGRENQSARDNGEAGATILRFPREWFGPPEELVPFGPRAAGSPVAGDEGSDGASSEIDAHAGALRADALRADAFWTEEAAAVHDAVDAGERLDVAEVARSGAGFGRRNLVIACCAVGLLLLVATQVFPSGSAPPARQGRAAAAVHMHPWTAISHPALSRRTPPKLKPGARHAPAPSRARESSPAVTQSASSESSPQSAPAATPVEAAPAPSNTETAQSSGPSQADASAASAKSSSSQPAFGANGTLGPGSSPNS